MRKWLIRLLGGLVNENEIPVIDAAPADVPAAIPEVVAVETDFAKVKAVLAQVETDIEETYDDALALAKKIGGDVESKLKVFLNVAGFAVPAFDDIVAFIKKHA